MNGTEASVIVARAQDAGMSITQIAERVGCSRMTVYDWRKSDRRVQRSLARALRELDQELGNGRST